MCKETRDHFIDIMALITALFLIGLPIMLAWNCISSLFELKEISYLQAVSFLFFFYLITRVFRK